MAGVETDFQGSTLNGSYYNYTSIPPYSPGYEYGGQHVQWWGTVRSRLGYALGNILPYLTGGFAYGHTTDYFGESGFNSFAFGSTHVGWTAGAGIEYALTHNVSFKFEYLFTDLCSRTSANVYAGYESHPGYYTRTSANFSTVRAGLNWKFDGYTPFASTGTASGVESFAGYTPPLMISWTGPYVGINVGVSGGNGFETPGEYGHEDFYIYRATNRGFSGGGQIGYDYQFPGSRIIAGIETDFQGSTLDGKYYDYVYTPPYDSGYENFGQHVQWWGTVRSRVGYALGNILPYVTGGFAYGHTNDYCISLDSTGAYYNYSFGATHVGWTAGAGIEYALTRNLTLKAEYLFTDLGSRTSPDVYEGYENSPGYYTRTSVNFSTARVGLNWKFGWFAPPPAPPLG